MNRFSLPQVKDREINQVLQQVQDALNALVDMHTTVVVPTKQAVAQVDFRLSANLAYITGTNSVVRMKLSKNMWMRVDFPGDHDTIPNFVITCRSINTTVTPQVINFNRLVTSELRNVTTAGFEIKVKEDCMMQLEMSRAGDETIGYPVEQVEAQL
jgi:hypothetical protein